MSNMLKKNSKQKKISISTGKNKEKSSLAVKNIINHKNIKFFYVKKLTLALFCKSCSEIIQAEYDL